MCIIHKVFRDFRAVSPILILGVNIPKPGDIGKLTFCTYT